MEDDIINNVRSGDVKNGYQTRLVANGMELAEKIQIFDSGLDDRTIEMCKVLLWGDLCERDPQYAEATPVSCDYFRHAKDGSNFSDFNLLFYVSNSLLFLIILKNKRYSSKFFGSVL